MQDQPAEEPKVKRNAHQLKRPIIATCSDWTEPKKYNSNYRASKELKINPSTISYACKHNRVVKRDDKTYTFKYDDPAKFNYDQLGVDLHRNIRNIRNTVKQNYKLSAKKHRQEYFKKCIEQVAKCQISEPDQLILLIKYFENFIHNENSVDSDNDEVDIDHILRLQKIINTNKPIESSYVN